MHITHAFPWALEDLLRSAPSPPCHACSKCPVLALGAEPLSRARVRSDAPACVRRSVQPHQPDLQSDKPGVLADESRQAPALAPNLAAVLGAAWGHAGARVAPPAVSRCSSTGCLPAWRPLKCAAWRVAAASALVPGARAHSKCAAETRCLVCCASSRARCVFVANLLRSARGPCGVLHKPRRAAGHALTRRACPARSVLAHLPGAQPCQPGCAMAASFLHSGACAGALICPEQLRASEPSPAHAMRPARRTRQSRAGQGRALAASGRSTRWPGAADLFPGARSVQPDLAAVQPDLAAVQPDLAAVQPDRPRCAARRLAGCWGATAWQLATLPRCCQGGTVRRMSHVLGT